MYVFSVATPLGTGADVMSGACEGVREGEGKGEGVREGEGEGCDGERLTDSYEPTVRENKVFIAAQSYNHINSLFIDARKSSSIKALPTVLAAILSSRLVPTNHLV